MTKEELKQEAEDNKPPYAFCALDTNCELWKDGYKKGAEPREKRIAELEATCNKWFEHLKSREEELLNELNNQNAKYNKQIADLEKENADLERKLEQTEKDLADYQFNYPTIKELQKERDYQKQARSIAENAVVDLQKENAELKEKVNILDNCDRLGDVITEAYKDQLTKAKELLKQLVDIEYAINIPKEKIISLRVKAEQFLSEVGK